MRKIYLAMFMLCALFIGIKAQEDERAKIFRGYLAGKSIQMTLKRNGDKLNGTYFYQKIGKDLNLSGTIDSKGNFRLDERDAKNLKTGEFKGTWKKSDDESIVLEGDWTNPKTKESLGFTAEEQMIFFSENGLNLNSRNFVEKNKIKLFDIEAAYPELSSADSSANAARFNQIVKNFVTAQTADFRKDMLAQDAEQIKYIKKLGANNYLDINYSIEYADDKTVSVSFINSTFTGGAHPNYFSKTINFDLEKGKQVELSDLFKPNSNYLKFISDYSIKKLKGKLREMSDDEWIKTGAGPKEENFSNWNITRKGILITFDPYQVAAYAAGQQDVLIPYVELKNILREETAASHLWKR